MKKVEKKHEDRRLTRYWKTLKTKIPVKWFYKHPRNTLTIIALVLFAAGIAMMYLAGWVSVSPLFQVGVSIITILMFVSIVFIGT